MKDSALQKEFKHSDVERIRNLVKKDFTSKTKAQSGYTRIVEKHSEGEVWEEGGAISLNLRSHLCSSFVLSTCVACR